MALAFFVFLEVIAQGQRPDGQREGGIKRAWDGYKSKRWAAKRKEILRRDRYQCQQCRRYGLAVDATVVHHAHPVEDYPELAWCEWNLVSLCAGCHNAMHDRETGALTDLGMSWRRRVSPPSLGPHREPPGRPGGRTLSDGEKNGGGGSGVQELSRGQDAPANDAAARSGGGSQYRRKLWAERR